VGPAKFTDAGQKKHSIQSFVESNIPDSITCTNVGETQQLFAPSYLLSA
jgi:hypothetical protein